MVSQLGSRTQGFKFILESYAVSWGSVLLIKAREEHVRLCGPYTGYRLCPGLSFMFPLRFPPQKCKIIQKKKI